MQFEQNFYTYFYYIIHILSQDVRIDRQKCELVEGDCGRRREKET